MTLLVTIGRAADAEANPRLTRRVGRRYARSSSDSILNQVGERASRASEIRDDAPWISGVVLNLHAERGNAPLGTEFETLVGSGSLEEGEAPLRVRVSAFAHALTLQPVNFLANRSVDCLMVQDSSPGG